MLASSAKGRKSLSWTGAMPLWRYASLWYCGDASFSELEAVTPHAPLAGHRAIIGVGTSVAVSH